MEWEKHQVQRSIGVTHLTEATEVLPLGGNTPFGASFIFFSCPKKRSLKTIMLMFIPFMLSIVSNEQLLYQQNTFWKMIKGVLPQSGKIAAFWVWGFFQCEYSCRLHYDFITEIIFEYLYVVCVGQIKQPFSMIMHFHISTLWTHRITGLIQTSA